MHNTVITGANEVYQIGKRSYLNFNVTLAEQNIVIINLNIYQASQEYQEPLLLNLIKHLINDFYRLLNDVNC